MSKIVDNKKLGIISPLDYNNKKSVKFAYWVMFAFLITLVIISIVPVLYAFFSGFKDVEEFYSSDFSFFPKSFDFSKLTAIAGQMHMLRSLTNSLMIFALTLFGEIIVGGIAGYTISRLRPKGSKLLFRVMLWTMMMPHTLSLVTVFLIWVDFPLIHINFQNTFIPFLVGSFCNIFNILLFKNFFDGIPNSIIEAAKCDGCNNIRIFSSIVLPLSKPIVGTISIYVFTATWNNFMGPFLYLKDPKLSTVALSLYNISNGYTEPEQLLASFLVMIPSLLVFVICSNKIIGNDMSAGVKE